MPPFLETMSCFKRFVMPFILTKKRQLNLWALTLKKWM